MNIHASHIAPYLLKRIKNMYMQWISFIKYDQHRLVAINKNGHGVSVSFLILIDLNKINYDCNGVAPSHNEINLDVYGPSFKFKAFIKIDLIWWINRIDWHSIAVNKSYPPTDALFVSVFW